MSDIISDIHIYIDKKKNATIVIYYPSEMGFFVDIGDYKEIMFPYTAKELGTALIETYKKSIARQAVTKKEFDESTPSFKKITNGKGFIYWLRRHECISVVYQEIISVEYKHRADSGDNRGYSMHREDYGETEIELPIDADKLQIVNAIDEVYFVRNKKHLCLE